MNDSDKGVLFWTYEFLEACCSRIDDDHVDLYGEKYRLVDHLQHKRGWLVKKVNDYDLEHKHE